MVETIEKATLLEKLQSGYELTGHPPVEFMPEFKTEDEVNARLARLCKRMTSHAQQITHA